MEDKNAGGGEEKGKRRGREGEGEAEEKKGKPAGEVASDNPALQALGHL